MVHIAIAPGQCDAIFSGIVKNADKNLGAVFRIDSNIGTIGFQGNSE
jgi:hypothetical protein